MVRLRSSRGYRTGLAVEIHRNGLPASSTRISYAIRGLAKKKKGIGLNINGKNKRRFRPNLQKRRLWFAEEKRFVTLTLSTAALRTINKNGLASVIRQMRARGDKV